MYSDKKCALCENQEEIILCRKGALKTGKKFDITNVVCKKCGLVFNYPQISKEQINKFFTVMNI